MRTLANILWHFPFFGFVSAAIAYLLGVLLTLTVIAAPIGLGLMQYGKFLLAPFSYVMIKDYKNKGEINSVWQGYSLIVTILYFPFGILLCLITILQILGLVITIIGIPAAIILAKSLGTYLNPVGKVCAQRNLAEEIERRRISDELDNSM